MVTALKSVPVTTEGTTLAQRVSPSLSEFARKASATEQARMVSPESIERIREAGFFRAFVPHALGGDARALGDFCGGIRAIAAHCPSTAWVTGVLSVHASGVASYPQVAQDAVWASGPDTIIASSGSPIIKAQRVEGGALLNGRGRWSSGCDHADFIMLGFKLPDPSNRQYPEHRYSDFMGIIPKGSYVIEDNWYSMGMRGSGSKDVVVKDLFVPHDMMERSESVFTHTTKGAGIHDAWQQHVPFPILFGIFMAPVALGCADGMIREYTTRQKTRKNAYNGNWGITSVPGYMRLAESTHEIKALSAFLDHQLRLIQRYGEEGQKLTEAAFSEMQSPLNYVINRCVQLIDRLFAGAGSSAMAEINPLQRFWRDAHTVSMHTGGDYDVERQRYGRFLIGLPGDPTL